MTVRLPSVILSHRLPMPQRGIGLTEIFSLSTSSAENRARKNFKCAEKNIRSVASVSQNFFRHTSSMLNVHSIETFGTHEGPGIRLVVFLQGCYFRCLYCHNPDTQELSGGTPTSVSEIVRMVEKQKVYFGDKGGVTISGGEPTIQAKELIKLFRELKKCGIHTALDSNGALLNPDTKKLYELTDLLLLDVKHIDDTWHRKVTGMSNANTLALAEYREKTGKPMWLRYVLVPGFTDQEEYLVKLGEHFKTYKHIERLEILPYHTLGAYKYTKLGRKNPLEGVSAPTTENIFRTQKILSSYFPLVTIR